MRIFRILLGVLVLSSMALADAGAQTVPRASSGALGRPLGDGGRQPRHADEGTPLAPTPSSAESDEQRRRRDDQPEHDGATGRASVLNVALAEERRPNGMRPPLFNPSWQPPSPSAPTTLGVAVALLRTPRVITASTVGQASACRPPPEPRQATESIVAGGVSALAAEATAAVVQPPVATSITECSDHSASGRRLAQDAAGHHGQYRRAGFSLPAPPEPRQAEACPTESIVAGGVSALAAEATAVVVQPPVATSITECSDHSASGRASLRTPRVITASTVGQASACRPPPEPRQAEACPTESIVAGGGVGSRGRGDGRRCSTAGRDFHHRVLGPLRDRPRLAQDAAGHHGEAVADAEAARADTS